MKNKIIASLLYIILASKIVVTELFREIFSKFSFSMGNDSEIKTCLIEPQSAQQPH